MTPMEEVPSPPEKTSRPVIDPNFRPGNLGECLDVVRSYFDAYAPTRDQWKGNGYHQLLLRYYQYYIPKGARVLEVGSGTGDLLAALEPEYGVGVDLSPQMTALARSKYTQAHLRFESAAIEEWELKEETFDYIVLSDVAGFFYDILAVFRKLRRYCHHRTRIICNIHSRLWQPVLGMLESIRLRDPQPVLNWVTTEDLGNLFHLAGFETVETDSRVVFPAHFPLLGSFLNRALAPFWPFRHLCLTNWVVARLPMALQDESPGKKWGVSVICACRNEEGNIPKIVERFPDFGSAAELIFVEGHSKDGTLAACQKVKAEHPEMDISVYQQTGKGKGDAVRLGFEKARHEILMILDADMTVQPEDLPDFVEILRSGCAEMVNGSRLVYPMEGKAMRFLNLLGNKFFSLAFSYLIGQQIKDTLCGTKVMLKSDYKKLAAQRIYFGDFDPFGDFDLLFGSARLGLKISDFPIRYRDRTYGETNISRFRHGMILLRMCGVALLRLKMR